MAHFQKDGLWIQGGTGALANVSEDSPYIPGQLGKVLSIKSTDGKVPRFYQYVQRYTTDSATAVSGHPAYWVDLDDFIVSAESTDGFGGTTNPVMAGVFLGASPAAGKYGFIQVGGIASVGVTDTVLAGDDLVISDNDQLVAYAKTIAITSQATQVPTKNVVAVAVGAVATSTDSAVSAVLRVFRNGW